MPRIVRAGLRVLRAFGGVGGGAGGVSVPMCSDLILVRDFAVVLGGGAAAVVPTAAATSGTRSLWSTASSSSLTTRLRFLLRASGTASSMSATPKTMSWSAASVAIAEAIASESVAEVVEVEVYANRASEDLVVRRVCGGGGSGGGGGDDDAAILLKSADVSFASFDVFIVKVRRLILSYPFISLRRRRR